MSESRYHLFKAVVRGKVAQLCKEAAELDPRFKEAASYFAASCLYELALAFKALAAEAEARNG